jgi:hypothetical protein
VTVAELSCLAGTEGGFRGWGLGESFGRAASDVFILFLHYSPGCIPFAISLLSSKDEPH